MDTEQKLNLESQINRLKTLCVQLDNNYTDYVILTRTKDDMFMWQTSNKTWAYGAVLRFANYINAEDMNGEEESC